MPLIAGVERPPSEVGRNLIRALNIFPIKLLLSHAELSGVRRGLGRHAWGRLAAGTPGWSCPGADLDMSRGHHHDARLVHDVGLKAAWVHEGQRIIKGVRMRSLLRPANLFSSRLDSLLIVWS